MQNVEEGKYKEASVLYEDIKKDEELDSDSKEEIENKLVEKIELGINDMFEKYQNDEVTYKEYKEKIDGYKMLNINNINKQIDKVENDIKEIRLVRESLEKGEKEFQGERYEEAIISYSKIKEDQEEYGMAVQRIEASKEKLYKNTMDSSEQKYKTGNYKGAIEELKKIEKYHKDDSVYLINLEKYNSEFIQQQLPEAEGLIEEKKYSEALAVIESIIAVAGSTKELAEKKTEYKKFEEEYRKKRKEQLLSKTVKEYDNIDDVTFIAPKGFEPKFIDVEIGKTSFYPRLHISGEFAQLVVTAGFGQEDWVFIEEIIFNIDGERITWDLEYDERGSEVVMGGIYEWLVRGSLSHSHILNDIEKIINSNDAKMRFQGERQRDYTITETDKERFRLFLELLTYYEQI